MWRIAKREAPASILVYMPVPRSLARLFPVPRYVTPRAAGIDITDASIKWVLLRQHSEHLRISSWGEIKLEPGIVENGIVKNVRALSDALASVREQLGGVRVAHAALPEKGAFVFSMNVPNSGPEIGNLIEFELVGRVPVPVQQMVYDYDVIEERPGTGVEIAVVVFVRDVVEAYVRAFDAAGITLMSMEVEARSIARAVTAADGSDPVSLLVDSGKSRTGFAIIKRGHPIFTSTVDVGGKDLTRVVVETLSVSEDEAQVFKNEVGIIPKDPERKKATEALAKVAETLAAEIERHYRFWDTRRNEHGERVTPVEQVLLVGGSANLMGLDDFVAGKVHAYTERPNVWRHVASFDEYIPPIDFRTSLQYVTAVGLSLRGIL
jgi:type IV pilus assembly protein PilM